MFDKHRKKRFNKSHEGTEDLMLLWQFNLCDK